MKDGVIIPKEVDLINSKRLSAHLLDNTLDNLVASSLPSNNGTIALLTTLTFLL